MHHDNYSESGKQLSDMESILKGMGFAEPVEEGKMSKEKHKKEAKKGKRWQDSDGDGKWYEPGEDVKEGVRDDKTAERKARLEKKRGMKLDDHPEYKKEEVEQVNEADSLAAMAARREKRLAAQRKKMGTSSTGQDFGHDYGISSAERKKRQDAEFAKFVGRGKKTTKEELEVEEGYKGKHGQSDKEYAASRSQGGKMISGDDKRSGAEYTHGRRVKAANPGMQPDVGGKTKPKSQGKMDKGTRAELVMRKANLKKESVCEYCGGKGCDKCEKKELKKESLSFKQFMEKTQVEEGLKAARDNVGASKCWKGYKAKGTKMKNGKEVPNCVPEEVHLPMATKMIEEGYTEEDVRLAIEWREDGFNVIFEEDGFFAQEVE
jgi:hypothetical protein